MLRIRTGRIGLSLYLIEGFESAVSPLRYTTKESKVAPVTIVATDKEAKTAVVLFLAAHIYRLSFALRAIDACHQGIDFRMKIGLVIYLLPEPILSRQLCKAMSMSFDNL